jgi:hypothetical protein
MNCHGFNAYFSFLCKDKYILTTESYAERRHKLPYNNVWLALHSLNQQGLRNSLDSHCSMSMLGRMTN